MSENDLFRAFDGVDDDILERSEAAAHEKNRWLKWGAMAACLCLVIAGIVLWRQNRPAAGPTLSGDGVTPPQQNQPAPNEGTGPTPSEEGVTIPPMDVSLSDDIQACWIAFFIYQGREYVWYERLCDAEDMVGEQLGTSTGFDGLTRETGFVELSGSVKGNFYAVKGYDPSFMLCMKEGGGTVAAYICNSGITLKYGSELYEDRLRLSGRMESVQYESRFSWYYGKDERYQLNSVNDIVLDFIRGIDAAQFVLSDSVPLDKGWVNIENETLYLLYFQMEDGMTVQLRLHENGYVRFDGMRDVCVQVPQERYAALLELLDSRADSTAVEVEPTFDYGRSDFEDCLNDAELGRYVPTYAPEDLCFATASIYPYWDYQTDEELGTKEIWLNYERPKNPHDSYWITVTWAEECDRLGWVGPMIDAADLSVEAISEGCVQTEKEWGETFLKLDVSVRYGDVCVHISGYGIDAETAFEILRSVG